MTYEEWEQGIPEEFTNDPVWTVKAYRLALFAGDIGWPDVTKLSRDFRTRGLSGQLFDALGSIGGNVAEGYSRGYPKERARFYEFSLGSAREARHWYWQGRHILGPEVAAHRIAVMTDLIRLLLTMVPQQRRGAVHEPLEPYGETPE